jgi:RNA polymerase sigma-70 factor (ECF subfamily)
MINPIEPSWGLIMAASIGISAARSEAANGLAFRSQPSVNRPSATPAYGAASDEALLARICGLDKAAMHALYSRYNVRLYRFVMRLTHDASLAEDLVSEVFVDVWRSARTFQAQSKASTWLYSIARHKAFSALRRRSEDSLADDCNDKIEDVSNTPEEAMLQKDRGALLQLCLSRLSSLHREVIDLVYYHEKPIHEVAAITGVSENTVKTRLHYARRNIEQMLSQAGVASLH